LLPTAHIFATLILWWILRRFLPIDNAMSLAVMIVCGVCPDLDVIYDVSHRRLITHTFTFWIGVSVLLSIFSPTLAIIAFASASIHLTMDMLDYKIRPFYPIIKRWMGLNFVDKYHKREKDTLIQDALFYLKTPPVIVVEAIIDIIGLIILVKSFGILYKVLVSGF